MTRNPLSPAILACAAFALTACGPQTALVEVPQQIEFRDSRPDGADASCWDKQVSPAVIETVTRQVLDQPATLDADGTVIRPASYRTETTQEIVQDRKDNWFETPCAGDMTPEFIASLQRALAVRGYYIWSVNGQLDARTRSAIRRYQAPRGLDSGTLSLVAAQQLGLSAVELDGLSKGSQSE